jgi:ferritin-like metal-binding protein YciE
VTDVENYHERLRDAALWKKQAEDMLKSMAKRGNNYPELGTRIRAS